MNRKLEIELEMKICSAVIDSLIAAGYKVGVNDGEDTTIKNSTDKEALMKAVFTTDEDYILAYKDNKQIGWVRLIYGNCADLISDYTCNLEDSIKPANDLANSYS